MGHAAANHDPAAHGACRTHEEEGSGGRAGAALVFGLVNFRRTRICFRNLSTGLNGFLTPVYTTVARGKESQVSRFILVQRTHRRSHTRSLTHSNVARGKELTTH